MAVFMINVCKFNGCGRTFPNLGDLIHHIEDTHIDYDPLIVEQKEASQPSCLPLSYVLRFFTEPSRKDSPAINSDVRRKLASVVRPPSIRSNTPTGSEFDEEEMLSGQSEDSNESWTAAEEFSSEFILRYGSRINASSTNGQNNGSVEKPFACPVPGCKKRYKNVNGIKYHSKNGHKNHGKAKKGFKCHCGKSYKTQQSLKNHSMSQHYSPEQQVPVASVQLPAQTLKPLSIPVMKALQGYVGSSQNHTSNNYNSGHIRSISHVLDTPQLDNTKTIRAVLENAGNKLSKDSFPTITTLTLPRHAINGMQISVPNIITTTNIPLIHHTQFEGDDTKPSQKFSSQYLTDSNVSPTNSLGILTPASSPVSNTCDKLVRLSKEDKHNQPKSHHVPMSPVMNVHILPLTPNNDTHDNFTVPSNILTH
ncbi:uncharacterized protein LOC143918739 [Arctopsyche grandis]|uniref:uncharacterized protein LOC143918739 n=1 Tax=Arctopsyche grandis TaxID=121162 RepID=UPI00406D7078